MKVLLIHPKTPETFWSFKYALSFINRKCSEIPLGLITIAGLLPQEWELKLTDMNVTRLKPRQLEWADLVFISGMNIEIESFQKVVRQCNELNKKVIAGGPLATMEHEHLLGVDHFVLNEAEITLPQFLEDLHNNTLKKVYSTNEYPDISLTPIPRWDLLDMSKYASMNLQYSRGCPFNCEFCSITQLNGHKPRTKSANHFLAEMNSLYNIGYRGNIFIVDDNFIGNRKKLKEEMLPAMIQWAKEKNYPFHYMTETSINICDDNQLIDMMVEAGFSKIFIGIETPNKESLTECGKYQNIDRDLVTSIKKLHSKGLAVSGGFIIGFDNDPPDIFEAQINLIQNSGVVTAMVGLLNAPTGTRLFDRLKQENRLINIYNGNNVDCSINFIPKMNYKLLINGYIGLMRTIYSHQKYYERVATFLTEYQVPNNFKNKLLFRDIIALIKSIFRIGIISSGRRYYWRLFLKTLIHYPQKFPMAITLAIYGHHFHMITKTI